MITPIGTLNINQIAERKDDLLVSSEDIKALARNVRNTAIDKFVESALRKFTEYEIKESYLTATCFKVAINEIAEEMRGAE